jgi:hypothetical protein
MKANVLYSGTQLGVTLVAENDSEKVLLQLVDKSTPMFNLAGSEDASSVVGTATANIELDKSKRATVVNIQP